MNKRTQSFSHLDKVFWSREGYTKGDVIAYYERVAPYILPYLHDRPNSLNRYPNGIDGIHFFQKNVAGLHTPSFVKTKTLYAKTAKRNIRYALCNNLDTLRYFANLGSIEVHPWNSRVGSLTKPDFMILDLDPGPRAAFDDVIEVARAAHRVLERIGAPNFCKTSGKKGLHIYIPLGAKYSYGRVRRFADRLARAIHQEIPELTSLEYFPSKRREKIHVDIMRNAMGQTTAAPYSLRPVPGALVSTPLQWSEVKRGLDPARFTMKTIFQRLEQKGDLWKPVLGRGIDLDRQFANFARQERSPR